MHREAYVHSLGIESRTERPLQTGLRDNKKTNSIELDDYSFNCRRVGSRDRLWFQFLHVNWLESGIQMSHSTCPRMNHGASSCRMKHKRSNREYMDREGCPALKWVIFESYRGSKPINGLVIACVCVLLASYY